MITIRPDQFKALQQAALEVFVRRKTDHLVHTFPVDCENIEEADLRARVRGGIRRAREYGITSQYDVSRFVDLELQLGEGFDSRLDWASDILQSDKHSPSERVNRLVGHQGAGENGGG